MRIMRVLVLSDASADEAPTQLAAVGLKDSAELSYCATAMPSTLAEPNDLIEAAAVVAEAMATASATSAHFDGIMALGTGAASVLTIALATIEAGDRAIAKIETAANALPAGQPKVVLAPLPAGADRRTG